MKKSLVALAALAAGASFAQSSVTIYGKLDQGLSRAIGASTYGINQASSSRVGFRGTEDLGGGLKANFTVEHRFTPDDGASAAIFWAGQSIVGLEGAFGKVDFGRTYSAAFYNALSADVFGWDGVANNALVTRGGAPSTIAVRLPNGVFYTSPSFNGLTLRVSHGQKEGTDLRNAQSFNLTYAAGPLSASIATETSTMKLKFTAVAAAYDFGMAKVNVHSSTSETAAGVESDGMVLGVTVPMGALSLKASYATLESGNVKSVQQFGIGARYALSKRTDLYTSYANNSKSSAARKNGVEFGVHHNF